MPVFSRAWGMENGKAKPFDQIVTEHADRAAGPTRSDQRALRQATSPTCADPDYWGAQSGGEPQGAQFNFDRITIKIYKDNTARLEALKAGEFDSCTSFYSAGDWARRVHGQALRLR